MSSSALYEAKEPKRSLPKKKVVSADDKFMVASDCATDSLVPDKQRFSEAEPDNYGVVNSSKIKSAVNISMKIKSCFKVKSQPGTLRQGNDASQRTASKGNGKQSNLATDQAAVLVKKIGMASSPIVERIKGNAETSSTPRVKRIRGLKCETELSKVKNDEGELSPTLKQIFGIKRKGESSKTKNNNGGELSPTLKKIFGRKCCAQSSSVKDNGEQNLERNATVSRSRVPAHAEINGKKPSSNREQVSSVNRRTGTKNVTNAGAQSSENPTMTCAVRRKEEPRSTPSLSAAAEKVKTDLSRINKTEIPKASSSKTTKALPPKANPLNNKRDTPSSSLPSSSKVTTVRQPPKLISQPSSSKVTTKRQPPKPMSQPSSSIIAALEKLQMNEHDLAAVKAELEQIKITRMQHIKADDPFEEEKEEPIGENCFLCEKDLSDNNHPVVGVLPCGHAYHIKCLELNLSEDQMKDPPCFLCNLLS